MYHKKPLSDKIQEGVYGKLITALLCKGELSSGYGVAKFWYGSNPNSKIQKDFREAGHDLVDAELIKVRSETKGKKEEKKNFKYIRLNYKTYFDLFLKNTRKPSLYFNLTNEESNIIVKLLETNFSKAIFRSYVEGFKGEDNPFYHTYVVLMSLFSAGAGGIGTNLSELENAEEFLEKYGVKQKKAEATQIYRDAVIECFSGIMQEKDIQEINSLDVETFINQTIVLSKATRILSEKTMGFLKNMVSQNNMDWNKVETALKRCGSIKK